MYDSTLSPRGGTNPVFLFLFWIFLFGSNVLCKFTLGFDAMTWSAACRADSIEAVQYILLDVDTSPI